ncbi:hypothetical protein LguiB_020862 [Lonicera macranthoides]
MIDFFNANDSSEIEAVDVIHNSLCASNQDYVFSLMHAIISRLRFVDLQNISLKVDDLSLQAPERTRSGHSNKYFCTKPPIENITFQNVGVDEAVRNSESDAVFKEWANSQIEVMQLLAVDGRLRTNFKIASRGSAHNYIQSYYMNRRDSLSARFYAKKDIISGVLLIWFCSKGHEQLNECAIFKGDPFRVCSLCYTL